MLDSSVLPAPIRKEELHGVVGPRRPAGAVKDYAPGFHMDALLCAGFRIFCGPLALGPALHVDLHFAAASDVSARFIVLAALRVNGVVTLPGLSENGDLHIFQQTGVLILEIRSLRRLYREDFLGPHLLVEREPARHPRHIPRSRCRPLFLFSMSDPLALQIATTPHPSQHQPSLHHPPPRLRTFASL